MIDWKKKLETIVEGNATYDLEEEEKGELLEKISSIRNQLNEIEELVSIVEWISPHGHKELREHIAHVETEAWCLKGFVEGIIYYYGKKEEK